MSTPEYALQNQKAWTELNPSYDVAGETAWQEEEITWGIWGIPERELHGLGDLEEWRGKSVIEMGCGTAYFSAWLTRLGALPVGLDITDAQLASARRFQDRFGVYFPLVRANAEGTPFTDASFDMA